MARAGRVCVREFVHQCKLRPAREYGVQIEFRERDPAMLE